jgi:hypothetical protein
MTIGHYPGRVLAMLAFSALILVALYFCNKAGVIPTRGTALRREEYPRIFAATLIGFIILAAGGALFAVAIYCGVGLNLISTETLPGFTAGGHIVDLNFATGVIMTKDKPRLVASALKRLGALGFLASALFASQAFAEDGVNAGALKQLAQMANASGSDAVIV